MRAYFALLERRDWVASPCGPAFAFTCGPVPTGRGSEPGFFQWTARGNRPGRPSVFYSVAKSASSEEPFGGGGFGTRRPLRFLTWRLELSTEQVSKAANVIERLKIEREQASVDLRRAAMEMADAVAAGDFDRDCMEAATERRLEAARRVQDAVSSALREFHDFLDERQREGLAALIRSREIVF